jgi:hypothetical protein
VALQAALHLRLVTSESEVTLLKQCSIQVSELVIDNAVMQPRKAETYLLFSLGAGRETAEGR